MVSGLRTTVGGNRINLFLTCLVNSKRQISVPLFDVIMITLQSLMVSRQSLVMG